MGVCLRGTTDTLGMVLTRLCCPCARWPCCSLQGLWHPARKVREVYWRHYNNLYIGAQDALVAFLPRLEDDAQNTYQRHELDLLL